MEVRNSKCGANIENGQSVLAVYTSDDVVVSITDAVLMLLLPASPATTRIVEAGTYITAACDTHKWINQLSLVAR